MEVAPLIIMPTSIDNSKEDKIKKEAKYELSYETKKYILILNITESNILILKLQEKNSSISSKYYLARNNLDDLNKIDKQFRSYDSMSEVFDALNNILNINQASIKKLNDNFSINFLFPLPGNKKKEIIIPLQIQSVEQKSIINELTIKVRDLEDKLNNEIEENKIYKKIINENKNVINELKEEIKFLKNKINDIEIKFDEKIKKIEMAKDKSKIYSSQNQQLKFVKDPKNLVYKEDICNSANNFNTIDKLFCAFKSFSGESLVVWGTPQYNIEFFDLEKNKIVKTITKAHNDIIISCRHYSDLKNRIDYLITSSYDKTVKVWDIRSYSYIVNIISAHSNGNIDSVSILCDEKEGANYVITSSTKEYMKVWDFNGKNLKSFGQNDENTYFIDAYYDNKESNHYIINANDNDVKSYNFKNGELYHKYKGTPQAFHMSVIVSEIKEKQILIESDGNGYIRMWEFHTAILLKTISLNSQIGLRGICLWNDDYLFAAGEDRQIKLFDLNSGKFIKSFIGHTSTVCSLEKIVYPKYGECLISQGYDGKLKIWVY